MHNIYIYIIYMYVYGIFSRFPALPADAPFFMSMSKKLSVTHTPPYHSYPDADRFWMKLHAVPVCDDWSQVDVSPWPMSAHDGVSP